MYYVLKPSILSHSMFVFYRRTVPQDGALVKPT